MNTVTAHGSNKSVTFRLTNSEGLVVNRQLGAEEAAAHLHEKYGFKLNTMEPLVLQACRAGADANSFAQQIANKMGRPVIAPLGYVYQSLLVASDFLSARTARDALPIGQDWAVFYPVAPPHERLAAASATAAAGGTGASTVAPQPPPLVNLLQLMDESRYRSSDVNLSELLHALSRSHH